MMKKYKAKTSVSINVLLGGGVNKHISFTSLTGGGSVYYTDDKGVQEALERHYKFGKLFNVEELPEAGDKSKEAPESAEETAGVGAEEGLRVVNVSDIEEAQNYLADTYGISRTKIRKVESIQKYALENGITFVGL